MSRWRESYDPNAVYVARFPLTVSGREFKPGEVVPRDCMEEGRFRVLVEGRRLVANAYIPQMEAIPDNWEHAAVNSARSYDVAIEAMRERLERSKVQIGPHVLYCEDAEFILPTLGRFDACVTDPPYGIGKDGQKRTRGGARRSKGLRFQGVGFRSPQQRGIRPHA